MKTPPQVSFAATLLPLEVEKAEVTPELIAKLMALPTNEEDLLDAYGLTDEESPWMDVVVQRAGQEDFAKGKFFIDWLELVQEMDFPEEKLAKFFFEKVRAVPASLGELETAISNLTDRQDPLRAVLWARTQLGQYEDHEEDEDD